MTGWLRERKERKAAEEAQQEYKEAFARWEDQRDHVEGLIYVAEHLDELPEAMTEGVSVRSKKGEKVLAVGRGGGLAEPRVHGSHYVMKGVSFRVGQHAGTYMGVTNRQKTSGIVYGSEVARDVQDRITLALAIHDGELEHLVNDLQEQLHELEQAKPAASPQALA
jgi:hypothetical protein